MVSFLRNGSSRHPAAGAGAGSRLPRLLRLQPSTSRRSAAAPSLGLTPSNTTSFISPERDRFREPSSNPYLSGGSIKGPTTSVVGGLLGKRADGKSKFGRWFKFLILLSLLLLVMTMGFLSWVWFGPREESAQWRRLMIGPYNARSITLSGAAIRYSIATLAGINVAMMASIMVERHGVPRHRIAEASIARYTGSIVPLVIRPYPFRAWFGLLLPVQLLCGISSQFTSTILFSDFDGAVIRGFDQMKEINSGFGQEPKLGGTGIGGGDEDLSRSDTNPVNYETFAEYAEPEKKVVDPQVDDTGPTWRALIPIDSALERSTLADYRGPSKVFDSRVMCMYPNITTLTFEKTQDFFKLSGEGSIDAKLVPGLYQNDQVAPQFHFSCYLLPNYACSPGEKCLEGPYKTTWSHCHTEGLAMFEGRAENYTYETDEQTTSSIIVDDFPQSMSTLDPIYYKPNELDASFTRYARGGWYGAGQPDPRLSPEKKPGPDDDRIASLLFRNSGRLGQSWLIADTTEPEGEVTLYAGFLDWPDFAADIGVISSTAQGAWQTIGSALVPSQHLANYTPPDDPNAGTEFEGLYGKPGSYNISTRATFCFDNMMPDTAPPSFFDIHATAETNISEPRALWMSESAKYNMTDVLRQLDATAENLTMSERGVMSITKESFESIISKVKDSNITQWDGGPVVSPEYLGRRSSILCSNCMIPVAESKQSLYWHHVFVQTLEATGSAARALQAINTIRLRKMYMEFVSSYTYGRPATLTLLVTVQTPTRTSGFVAVTAIILVQLALFATSAVLFRKTGNTILGNAWLVISQVSSSPEAAPILAHAAAMTDTEVEALVAAEGLKAWDSDEDEYMSGRATAVDRFVACDGMFRRKVNEERAPSAAWHRVHV